MANQTTIRIGTRGSPLALKQVDMVRAALGPNIETETVIIKTSGDWNPADGEVPLPENQGGKACFAKEIEEALLRGAIDCAVHSMKDMDSTLPKGLVIPFMLPREDPRDALISREGKRLNELPHGAIIGTTGPRRKAFLQAQRPDFKIVPFRGNVGTRLEKLKAGDVDATLLAVAGLKRLGMANKITQILEAEAMLPPAGQGAIGIETRGGDADIMSIFSQINCLNTAICVSSERSFLRAIGGSCYTPVGAYATLENGQLHLRVMLFSVDGKQSWSEEITGAASTPEEAGALGKALGDSLKLRVPDGII